jgi:hypothetical protein
MAILDLDSAPGGIKRDTMKEKAFVPMKKLKSDNFFTIYRY